MVRMFSGPSSRTVPNLRTAILIPVETIVWPVQCQPAIWLWVLPRPKY
jgi:hypothetical protein